MWRRRVLFFCVVSWVVFVLSPWALGERISYFPFSALRKGMKAIGKTVLYGTKVEEFTLEIVDVVRARDITDSYFVVLVTDEKIRNLGGILAGMSGSPVYVRGRIAGALSHSFETQDHLVGVVTPIEAMLKIWKEEEIIAPLGKGQESIVLCFGLGSRAWERLCGRFKEKYGLRRVLAFPRFFSGEEEQKSAPLEPGSAIGVQLVTGDAEIVSIGTLTLRDGDRFLALGHPFLHRGRTQYFLSSVYVNFSLKGSEFPFKVGTPLEVVGVVEEDRSTGIAGRFGVFPRTTEVAVRVREGTVKREFHFSVVQEEDVLVDFLPELVLDAIDRTIDRQSPGSVDVRLRVVGSATQVEEEFFWVSESDVATSTAETLQRIFEILFKNPYHSLETQSVTVDIEVFPEMQRGWIISCDLPRIVKRGETVEGKVAVFLYRQGIRDIPFSFTLPLDYLPGEAEVTVRGKGGGGEGSEESSFPQSFEEYVAQKLNAFRSDGVDLEVVARGVSFKVHVFLPFILEGSAITKVWVN